MEVKVLVRVRSEDRVEVSGVWGRTCGLIAGDRRWRSGWRQRAGGACRSS
jgi:hypothetical protein